MDHHYQEIPFSFSAFLLSRGSFSKRLAVEIVVLLTPVVLFFFYVYGHAINVPFMDDMELISTINDLQSTPGDFLHILLRQQNDHRIFFSRLAMVVVYLVSGELNFRYAILLGFLSLVLLAYSFYLVYRRYRSDLLPFLPVLILLFSPHVYFVQLSALPAYQHALSVGFSLLSLYFLQGEKKQIWYWSIPLAFAATLTILDGLSILPIGLAWLLIQKRFRESLIFGVLSALWMLAYFTNFRFSSSSKLEFTADSLLVMLRSFITFIGTPVRSFSDTYLYTLTFTVGLIILLGTLWLLGQQLLGSEKRVRLRSLALSRLQLVDICMLRVLASGAMIAIGRVSYGVEGVTVIRYQVFSLSVLIVFYLLLLRWAGTRRRGVLPAVAIGLSLLSSGYAYSKYDYEVRDMVQALKADSYNFTHNQLFIHQYLNYEDPKEKFYRNFTFPVFFPEPVVHSWQNGAAASRVQLTTRMIPNEGRYREFLYPMLDVKVTEVPAVVPHQNVFLRLQNRQDTSKVFILSLSDKANWIKDRLLPAVAPTYSGILPLKIPAGFYETRLCWLHDGQPESLMVPGGLQLP